MYFINTININFVHHVALFCILHLFCWVLFGYQNSIYVYYVVFSACDQNVCENGGTCTQHDLKYRCDCPSSYSGSYCETCEYACHLYDLQCITGKHCNTVTALFLLLLTQSHADNPRNIYIVLGIVLGVAVVLTVVVILVVLLCCKFMPRKYKQIR